MVETAVTPRTIPPEVAQHLAHLRSLGPNPIRAEWDPRTKQFMYIETITHGRSNDGEFSVNQGGHTG